MLTRQVPPVISIALREIIALKTHNGDVLSGEFDESYFGYTGQRQAQRGKRGTAVRQAKSLSSVFSNVGGKAYTQVISNSSAKTRDPDQRSLH